MEYTKTLRRAFSLRSRSSKHSPEGTNQVKDKGQNKVKMKSIDLQNVPPPTKTSQLPIWSQSSPKKEVNERSIYDVPWDGPFIQAFVVLPKSRKTRLARLATYTVGLCRKLTMFIKSDEGPDSKMDSIGLTDFVTMSGLDIPDLSGWMYDLDPESGQRSWCVLADMLLCVFPNESEENPRKVIMLPGQEVKAMVFNSAKRDLLPFNAGSSTVNSDSNKTITGMLKYQIIITDPCSGVQHAFGLDKQEEVDRWVTLIRVAVSLDTEIFTDSDEEQPTLAPSVSIKDITSEPVPISETKIDDKSPEINSPSEDVQSHSPTSPTKSKIPRLRSSSIPIGLNNVSDGTNPKYIPTGLEKEISQNAKPTQTFGELKGSRGGVPDTNGEDSEGVKSNSPVFTRVKRSESLSTVSCISEDIIDPSKTELSRPISKSKRSSSSSLASTPGSPLMSLLRRYRSRATSSSSAETTSQDTGEFRQRTNSTSSCSSTSTDIGDKRNSGIGAKLVRKASTFKVKMFGSKGKAMEEETVSLGSLTNVKMSGYLEVKYLLKWNQFWCLVSQGNLHCFNTQSPSDTPELTLLLRECSVHFLTDNRSRKYTFKLCQLNARSVYFAAKDNIELSKWILALRREIKAWDDTQTHARPPPGVNLNRHSLGSQLSLDSSVSIQSHASLTSQNSGTSQNSSGSGSSSLSSISQNSNDITSRSKKLQQKTHKNVARSKSEEPQKKSTNKEEPDVNTRGPMRGFYPLSENSTSAKAKKMVPVMSKSLDSPVWQTPCPAHGLESAPPYQWNEHFQRSSSFKGSQSSCESLGWPTTPDSDGPDAVFGSSAESNNLTSSLRNMAVSLKAKYSSSPKYDFNLHHVWKNDKGYQLQMLKARVSALPDKPAIFNRHLPGPYNEGLLMVSDSTPEITGGEEDLTKNEETCEEEATITRSPSVKISRKLSLKRKNSRRRSIKDIQLPGANLQRRNSWRKAADAVKHPLDTLKSRQARSEEAKKKTENTMASSNHDFPVNFDASSRRRSLSDGQLPVTLQQFKEGYDPKGQGQVKERSNVEVTIPARELSNPTLAGYLENKEGDDWKSCWCVLKDNTLYKYAAPIDDVTQDVLQLPGYLVQPCLPTPEKYIFQLVHQEYSPITMSAENSTETETWMERLHLATQKLTLDSLNLDMTNSIQYDNREVSREELEEEARKQWQRELLKLKKQQLLREVLQQKEELTKKQNRLVKSKQSSFEDAMFPGTEEKDGNEQMLRERAILKQRKVSAQLKLEMVQKELHTTLSRTKTKKRGFKLPGLKSDKPPVTAVTLTGLSPDTDSLESQIKELTSELDSIHWELAQVDRKSATLGSASHRRKTFAINSMGSSESAESRERSRSDLSVTKVGRGYPSEPNLLNVGQQEILSARLESLSPEALMSDRRMDVNTKVQLMSYNKLSSQSDIPMIDDSPSPKRNSRLEHAGKNHNRQSLDSESIPVFGLDSPVSSPVDDMERTQLGYEKGNHGAGLYKSCDWSDIQGYSRERSRPQGSPESTRSQRTVPRSKSESTNLKKSQISANALAEIAAFEELVQKKMRGTSSPNADFSLAYR